MEAEVEVEVEEVSPLLSPSSPSSSPYYSALPVGKLPLATSTDTHHHFPPGFVWGTATASYQIEGAACEGGRSPSIWDTFSHTKGNVDGGHTGDVACDHYHRSGEDIALMASLGIQHYRFSLSWSRIFPQGTVSVLNEEGLQFYNGLIDCLREHHIEPAITLYHWDLPQCLDEKGGWLSNEIVGWFADYAEKCFGFFGDRVKTWITLNEPWCSSVLGYCTGEHAPGHIDDPGRKPYLASHHLLLAHAEAVRRYRSIFQIDQGGVIGLTLNTNWWEPLSESEDDIIAQKVTMDFQFGWFAEPLYFGDYPQSMKEILGDRLPKFTKKEMKKIKGSTDFMGINHYSTGYVGVSGFFRQLVALYHLIKLGQLSKRGLGMVVRMMTANEHYLKDIGTLMMLKDEHGATDMGWPIQPWGFRKLLEYIQRKYSPNGGIFVFENGMAEKERKNRLISDDEDRLNYIHQYLIEAHKAMKNGVDLRGYFYWSFFDNYEWSFGYFKRFGLVHVDYDTQIRTPKLSAKLFGEICSLNQVQICPNNISFGKEYILRQGGDGKMALINHKEEKGKEEEIV